MQEKLQRRGGQSAKAQFKAASTGRVGIQASQQQVHHEAPSKRGSDSRESIRRGDQCVGSRTKEAPATAESSYGADAVSLSCIGLGGHLPALQQQAVTLQGNGGELIEHIPHPQTQEQFAAPLVHDWNLTQQLAAPLPPPATHAEKGVKLQTRRANNLRRNPEALES